MTTTISEETESRDVGSVNSTVHIQSENEAAPSSHCTSVYPVSAYKDGHLTLSGWLLVVEGCPRSQSNFLAGKTPHNAALGKELLTRWQRAGYPDLGEWPPPGIELFDFVLATLAKALVAAGLTNS
jgi:hypothetical protein